MILGIDFGIDPWMDLGLICGMHLGDRSCEWIWEWIIGMEFGD